MRKVIQKMSNSYCEYRIKKMLPEAYDDMKAYKKKSNTTGTQWITLWMCVTEILKHKPKWILESGTGSSTLLLAATIHYLKQKDPSYNGHLVSMESVQSWHDIAQDNLPSKYRDVVEIIYGPRASYHIDMFRGKIHTNIPKQNYSFFLIDGPNYIDEDGITFCADMFHAMEFSHAPFLRGVVDGRASTVMVLQTLFGVAKSRYWHSLFAAKFEFKNCNLRAQSFNTPKDYKCSPLGRLNYIKFRSKN